MAERQHRIGRVVNMLSLLVALGTLLLTSPLLIEYYTAPKVIYQVAKLTDGGLRLEIENVGRRKAVGLSVEIAPRVPTSYTRISMRALTVIPPKQYRVTSQDKFTIIKFEDSLLRKERITVHLDADIPIEAYPFLWVRVTSDEGEAERVGPRLE